MLRLKEGDPVRILDRTPTTADARSGLFYNHYRNLHGAVFKLYGQGEQQLAAVDVAVESLPAEIAQRHQEVACQMQAGMTGAARRGGDEMFRLRYVVLVAVADLSRMPAPRAKA